MEDVTCSLILLAVVQCLDITGEVIRVTTGEGVGFICPIHCSGIQLLRCVLLDKGSGFD